MKKINIAQIENINGDDPSCMIHEPIKTGTFLLKLTLTFLKEYKNEFNIEWIILSDHSVKICGNKLFRLMKLSTLTDGETWYGKYMFRPIKYTLNNVKYDKYQLEKYEANKRIMSIKLLKDINFKKYFSITANKFPEFKLIMDDMLSYIGINQNKLLKDYLRELLDDYKFSCKY